MRIKILVSITSLLLLVSCCPRETPDMSFVVVNHSKDSVYYKCSYGDGYLPSQWYSKVLDEHRVLKPEEMDTVYYHTNYFYHGSKLSVTFIKCQTLKELTWPIILERDTVDRVLFYTLEELQDAHYIVEYK